MSTPENTSTSITIDLGENLTFNEHKIFRDMISPAIAEKKGLIFNCRSLVYIDSAGLGMLLLAKHETEKFGKKAEIHGLQGTALELLKTVAFDKHFNIKS